ncbi:MAG: hypothetical protein CM15mP74_32650 [Halieaceae bacterium]|nr:MAG: hypothetical protein CM15mP74_32650 [Halieaceae bacterium]
MQGKIEGGQGGRGGVKPAKLGAPPVRLQFTLKVGPESFDERFELRVVPFPFPKYARLITAPMPHSAPPVSAKRPRAGDADPIMGVTPVPTQRRCVFAPAGFSYRLDPGEGFGIGASKISNPLLGPAASRAVFPGLGSIKGNSHASPCSCVFRAHLNRFPTLRPLSIAGQTRRTRSRAWGLCRVSRGCVRSSASAMPSGGCGTAPPSPPHPGPKEAFS